MTATKKRNTSPKPQAGTRGKKSRRGKAEAPFTDSSATDAVLLEEVLAPAPAEGNVSVTESPVFVPPTGRKPRKAKDATESRVRKPGALDAAARVLAEAGEPMTCKGMIKAMATKGYWTSPNGKTPDATLYAAILKEITTKRGTSRFHKTGRGLFALREERA